MLPLQRFRAVRICRLTCEGDAMRDDDVSVLPRPQREARGFTPTHRRQARPLGIGSRTAPMSICRGAYPSGDAMAR
jgi:hypothetical protein